MKFVKIKNYVEKSFEDKPSFIIEMSDGLEYISNGCEFAERTDENIELLIVRYKCGKKLDELLAAAAIEMCDVVDASYMFWDAPITEFSGDMSNVVDARCMFSYSQITKFSSDMSLVRA